MSVDPYAIVVRQLLAEDGGGFLAVIPDLPGCMGDGDTAEAAVSDARDAALAWIEAARAEGREIPEPGLAAARLRERDAAMLNAMRALLSYADNADQHIDRLEKLIGRLNGLLEREQAVYAPEAVVIAATSRRLVCH